MPRYFTLQQARATLPRVRSVIREAIALKAEMQAAEAEIRDLTRKVTMSGGMSLNPARVVQLRDTRDSSTHRLKARLEAIHETGCLVKDLDIGLLDFPTLYRGREVYLCWRASEADIQCWHGVDEGFRGRKPIDSDFLANHRGDDAD